MPQEYTSDGLFDSNDFDRAQPDIDDMSIADTSLSGFKGGQVSRDALDDASQEPMSLVDFLWKHHND